MRINITIPWAPKKPEIDAVEITTDYRDFRENKNYYGYFLEYESRKNGWQCFKLIDREDRVIMDTNLRRLIYLPGTDSQQIARSVSGKEDNEKEAIIRLINHKRKNV